MRSSMSWHYARTVTRWKVSLSTAIPCLSNGKSPPSMRQQFAPSLRIWSRKLPALKMYCCKVANWIPVFALIVFGTVYPNAIKAAEKLRIAWAGGSSSAPIWIVQEKGLLKKQGVDAEIIKVSASTVALQAMPRRVDGNGVLDREISIRSKRSVLANLVGAMTVAIHLCKSGKGSIRK